MPFEIKIIIVVLGGILVSVLALIHPVGAALLLFVTTPFDPLMSNLFGQSGNYVMIVPIALLLAKIQPRHWVNTFLGTRVQRALFFFLAAVSMSYLIGYLKIGPGAFFAYLQKITGFALIGIFATGLRDERYTNLCINLLTVSMTLFALLSMFEFYVGIKLFPTLSEFGAGGLMEAERTSSVHEARLRGAGDSVSINKFALQLLVPIGLSMGWLTSKHRQSLIVIPLVCLIVLLAALFGTISRSGMLGLAVGAAIVSISAYRLNPTVVLSTLILAGVLAFGASQALNYLDLDDEFESRLTATELNISSDVRRNAWMHGLRLFADSPIWGVGYGVKQTENVRLPNAPPDPHNAYVRVLTYYGLLGAAFFAYLLWTIFSTLIKSPNSAGDRLEYWRPYFLAGFGSLVVVNFFNSYFFDRYMFLVVGFAAALENGRRDMASQKIRSAEPSPEPKALHDWSTQQSIP